MRAHFLATRLMLDPHQRRKPFNVDHAESVEQRSVHVSPPYRGYRIARHVTDGDRMSRVGTFLMNRDPIPWVAEAPWKWGMSRSQPRFQVGIGYVNGVEYLHTGSTAVGSLAGMLPLVEYPLSARLVAVGPRGASRTLTLGGVEAAQLVSRARVTTATARAGGLLRSATLPGWCLLDGNDMDDGTSDWYWAIRLPKSLSHVRSVVMEREEPTYELRHFGQRDTVISDDHWEAPYVVQLFRDDETGNVARGRVPWFGNVEPDLSGDCAVLILLEADVWSLEEVREVPWPK